MANSPMHTKQSDSSTVRANENFPVPLGFSWESSLKIVTSVWVMGLTVISLQPLRPDPSSSLHGMHQSFHFVAFSITALLLRQCVAGREFFWTGAASIRASWFAVLTTIALGSTIESLQHFMYHNPMEWWDVRDDSLAAIGVIVLGHAARAFFRVMS